MALFPFAAARRCPLSWRNHAVGPHSRPNPPTMYALASQNSQNSLLNTIAEDCFDCLLTNEIWNCYPGG
jgi:hypothetical protein